MPNRSSVVQFAGFFMQAKGEDFEGVRYCYNGIVCSRRNSEGPLEAFNMIR